MSRACTELPRKKKTSFLRQKCFRCIWVAQSLAVDKSKILTQSWNVSKNLIWIHFRNLENRCLAFVALQRLFTLGLKSRQQYATNIIGSWTIKTRMRWLPKHLLHKKKHSKQIICWHWPIGICNWSKCFHSLMKKLHIFASFPTDLWKQGK